MSNAISKNKDANRLKPNAEMAVVMVMMLLLLLLLVLLLLVVVVVVNHQALDVLNVYFTYIHTNILYVYILYESLNYYEVNKPLT